MQILVTGATGFVGGALVERLTHSSQDRVRAAVRTASAYHAPSAVIDVVEVPGLSAQTDWHAALAGIETVIHCAARVHVMNERAADPLVAFREINAEGTLNLARQARQAGVKRFVFVSSIKVNGEQTAPGQPFRADTPPAPADAYGISKLEAEQGLLALAQDGQMDVVIVRPVLVYGPGVKANFAAMMRWLDKGIPLPLGAITQNRRSLVALDNLVDLLCLCTHHPKAAGEVFLVSDGEDLSTTELLQRMAAALQKPARLLPLPVHLIKLAAALTGRKALAQRLCGDLQVDIGKTRQLLDWVPPVPLQQGLEQAARRWLSLAPGKR